MWTPNSVVTLRVIGDYNQKADSGSDASFKIYSTRDRQFQDVIAYQGTGLAFPVPVTLGPTGFATQAVNYKTYKIAENLPRISNVNDYGFSAQLDLDFGDVSITSISGYRHFTSNDQSDPDYSPLDLIRITGARGLQESVSEELQVKGTNGDFDWLAGAYFSSERIRAIGPLFFGTAGGLEFAHLLNPAGAVGGAGAVSQTAKCMLGLTNTNPKCNGDGLFGTAVENDFYIYAPGDGYIDHFGTNGSTFSIFTHDIWHLTDELDLTMGARFNNERKHGFYDGGQMVWHSAAALDVACGTVLPPGASNNIFPSLNLLCPRQGYDRRSHEPSLTGTANMAWKPTDDMMFYAGYSRGFKTGPFSLDRSWANNPAITSPHSKAEVDDSVEVGSRLTLFDGMAIANTTLFYARYHNFQINTFNGISFALGSIPHVYSEGLEFEGQLAPMEGLNITASATWAHSFYGQDTVTLGVPAANPVSLAGKTLTQAPRLTLNGSVNYETPIDSDWTGFINMNANFRTKYNTGSNLNPNKEQEAFALVNGQIGVRSEDGMWEAAVWGRNIFNKHYNVVAFDTAFQGPSGDSRAAAISVFPGEPATYGVTLTAHVE